VRLVVAGAGEAARLVPDDQRISLIPRYIPEDEVDELLAGASSWSGHIPRQVRAV
jgi:hypothetical protein